MRNTALYSQGDESFIGGVAPSVSGRIVSPPPSPLHGEWDVEIYGDEAQLQSRQRDQQGGVSSEGGTMQKQREPGIPSRVLAHSRSFDVQSKFGKETSDLEARAVRRGKPKAAPVTRDRSETQEILRLPSPVPDLIE
jgi:hypothetical protein